MTCFDISKRAYTHPLNVCGDHNGNASARSIHENEVELLFGKDKGSQAGDQSEQDRSRRRKKGLVNLAGTRQLDEAELVWRLS